MTRKITTFILILLITLTFFPCIVSATASPGTVPSDTPQFDASPYSKTDTILLIDAKSGNILFEKNADARIFPASTTKILTCIIAIERGDLEAEFTVGKYVGGSSARSPDGLIPGEKIKLNDLLYGMMLPSGNDAAKTIALNMGSPDGSLDEDGALTAFSDMMNQTASEIGMQNSHFLSPSGLHKDEHYTTAKDMALLTRYAMKNEIFRKVVKTVEYSIPKTNKYSKTTELTNTNRLIKTQVNGESNSYYNPNVIGVKTGDTTQAGRCLVAAAKKDDMELIALIFGDRTDNGNDRWKIANGLFEFGFNNFAPIDITGLIANIKIPSVYINNASLKDPFEGNLELTPSEGEDGKHIISGTNNFAQELSAEGAELTPQIHTNSNLTAPIEKGQICGSVEYIYNGAVIYTADLVSQRDVAATYPDESPTAVTTQEPIDPDKVKTNPINPWWWLLIPGILVIALLVRYFLIKKRKRNRFKKRRRYRYNIRK